MILAVISALSLYGQAAELAPRQAIEVAARAAGRADLGAELARRCKGESLCRRIGAHGTRHNAGGAVFYAAAVAAGWLSPATCEHHSPEQAGDMGPRGILGLAAAYQIRHLGPCVAAEAIDLPIVSATLGLAHLRYLERRGFCTAEGRRQAWRRGIGRAREFKCHR